MRQNRLTKLKILLFTLMFAMAVEYIPQPSSATNSTAIVTSEDKEKFSLSDVPKYKNQASVAVHENKPYLQRKKKRTQKALKTIISWINLAGAVLLMQMFRRGQCHRRIAVPLDQ